VSAASALAADVKAGQMVYSRACKACHGADGAPNVAIAKMQKVEMKDLKASEVQGVSDAEMKTIITDGRGKMKPVRGLTEADVDNVVAYVRSLKK
jgi:mono/diheme cytochrome c family protein